MAFGAGAGDAVILRDWTAIPRVIRALVWIAGTLGAVVLGGRMLVMRHLRRVGPADAAGSGRMPQGPSMYEMEGPCFWPRPVTPAGCPAVRTVRADRRCQEPV